MAVDNVRCPTQFFDGFQHTARKENHAVVVVAEFFAIGINGRAAPTEIVVVVDKIDLHACRWQRGNFDNQRMVAVVDYQVHAGQALYLVQLIATLVDYAVTRHKNADFTTLLLHILRQFATHTRHYRFRQIRHQFLYNK